MNTYMSSSAEKTVDIYFRKESERFKMLQFCAPQFKNY